MKAYLLTLALSMFACQLQGQTMSNQNFQAGNPGNLNRQNKSDSYWSGTLQGQAKPAGPEEAAKSSLPKAEQQQTLSIIKPDAVKNRHVGAIISRFERNGLRIVALKETKLSKEQASKFYAVHKERPFYPTLVEFMTSGPVVVMVLEGPNAVRHNREIMGATDPSKANPGTLRADFAESVTRNAVHGSDSPETAKEEISFFFKPEEIFGNSQ